MNQIRSLRSRAVLERMIKHKDKGDFLQIGNTCEHVLQNAHRENEIDQLCADCLKENEARVAANMETTIKKHAPEVLHVHEIGMAEKH